MSVPTAQITHVPASAIVRGPNDRQVFSAVALDELAASINEHGLAQPPTLRPLPCGGYEIVAGERRVRAMRDVLGWGEIPALVRAMDDETASAIMLAENTGRVDLNPVEEAEAYQARITRFGWSVAKVAETAGVSVMRVRNRLDLLTLVTDVQHFVKIGQFPDTYALLLRDLDGNRQRIALRLYNRAPSMPLMRWRDLVSQLWEQQQAESQMGLFALELQLIDEVDSLADIPAKGKRALTGAQADRSLPPVRYADDDSMAPIFDRYIRDLSAAGHAEAAGALANVYNLFVLRGWVTVRSDVELPRLNADAGRVEDELHAVRV